MELKKGYKQSEVGIIPEDWRILQLGDIGRTFGGLSGKSKHDFIDGVSPYIPFMNIMANPIIDSNYLDYVNLKAGESQNLALKGDLFFNGSSETPEDVGMCSVLLEDIPNLYLNSFCFGFRLQKELNINRLYLSYYFRSKEGRKLFYSMAQGATRYNLSKANFNRIFIPVPALTEQTNIANTLSDTDAYISSLEKIIIKKRQIKLGLMKKLLKPKKGWEEKTLGDIVIYKNGKAHENCVVDNGQYTIVNSKFISTDGNIAKYSNNLLCPVSKDEILMVLSDIPNGKAIAKCFLVEKDNKYTLNQRICSLKSINTDPKFLFYLLNRNPYFLSFDDGAKQTNLRNIDVLNCPLTIPSNIEEQIMISNIISDMHSEISLLEEKLNKTYLIKQGLLQNLLTGKIRIV